MTALKSIAYYYVILEIFVGVPTAVKLWYFIIQNAYSPVSKHTHIYMANYITKQIKENNETE